MEHRFIVVKLLLNEDCISLAPSPAGPAMAGPVHTGSHIKQMVCTFLGRTSCMVTIGLADPDATPLDCNVCAWKTLTGNAVYKYKYINKTWHMRHVDLIICMFIDAVLQH